MVREIKRVRTYLVSLHDLKDGLDIQGDRVLEVVKIEGERQYDDPVIKLVTESEEGDD